MGTTGQSITLANSIIGVGILAMPFCFQQCGVLLATLILLSMGLVSRLCCYFLLKSALLARRRNFEFLAFHVFGSAGKLAVEVGIIGFLMGTCIAYFVVVGDLGPQIIAKMFNINQSDILRTSIMVIVSLVCVLPLGLLRNVDSLSNVSAATIGFYFCLVMKVISEAASQLVSSEWPARVALWRPAGVLQCVPIFSMALFCQTQLFEIFESLPTLSLEKMSVVTKNAIHICTGVYFTLGLFGYIAFSAQNISGNILMSLSPTMANDVIKLGFVMSLAFSFPLIIFPCRASLYSFLYRKVHPSHHDHIVNHSIPETTFRCITVAIIAVTLFISLLIPNIELVLGLVGSTIGVMICVVFPAACFINVTFKNTNERVLAKGVLLLGLLIMVLGTYANLQAAESAAPDRYDDKAITQERIDKIVEDFFEKMEKSDDKDVIIKPLEKNEAVPNSDGSRVSNEVKDSEVQPPNPVPPESQSGEKEPVAAPDKDTKLKDPVKPPIDEVDKVSETHPKNLQNKLNEAKIANGVKKNEIIDKPKEKPTQDEQKPTNQEKIQEKIDMMKQQQLVETIKQHGVEQKELIKEQKELLEEILKTKDEMQQNKKEADSNEAKKIAVESIQKIANIAIQSLSGVSDKPINADGDKKSEPLEKIANEAVQEIAKKAVETMEAIKEIQEKPKDAPKVENNANIATGNANTRQSNAANPVPVQNNVQASQNIPSGQNVPPSQNIPQSSNVQPSQNMQPVKTPLDNSVKIQNTNNLANQQPVANIQPVANVQPVGNNQPVANIPPSNPNYNGDQVAPNKPSSQPIQNNLNGNQKAHSHSPDEPQSYKQGEELQKDVGSNLKKNIVQNVPLALAMNGNSQVRQPQNAIIEPKPAAVLDKLNNNVQNEINVQNNGAKDVVNNLQNQVVRQKREVVDCTEKTSLKPEDKEICEMLVDKPNENPKFDDNSQELLKKVDLNNVLQKTLPIDTIHLRSLKSYDEIKER